MYLVYCYLTVSGNFIIIILFYKHNDKIIILYYGHEYYFQHNENKRKGNVKSTFHVVTYGRWVFIVY